MSKPQMILVSLVIAATAAATERTPEGRAVDTVLTRFHAAAAAADGESYFGLFTDGAVFIGTDAAERWNLPDFKTFAEPYFARGRGWTYTATARNIVVSPDGATAWFDEILWNDSYGICRGTGVLVRTDEGWRIAQYHLAIPIPNELSKELTTRIKEHENRPTD
jgi:ketosteroid isomerase-like protein